MTEVEAVKRAVELMTKWGLAGWRVVIDTTSRSRRLGYCHFGKKVIGLSRWYVEHNDPTIIDNTIKHEIAHALAWIRFAHHEHGEPWKQMCELVGCTPNRVRDRDTFVQPPRRFNATCGSCGRVFYRDTTTGKRVYYCPCQKGVDIKLMLDYGPNTAFTDDLIVRAAQRVGVDLDGAVGADVAGLLTRLVEATRVKDTRLAKSIRSKLRRLGHAGGLS